MEETNEQMVNEGMEETMAENTMDTAMPEKNMESETKNDKFVRLAEYRVNKLMTAIASLDKLHNRSAYDYTDEQVNIMFETIENQLSDVKAHFAKSKTNDSKFMFTFNK